MFLYSEGFDYWIPEELMTKVKVNKKDLLKKLKENREKHNTIFLEALDGYKKAVIEVLEDRLVDAKSGKRIPHHIDLVEPMDQTREYDQAIAMLEMSVDKQIELTQHEFAAYVMDKWGWSDQFTVTNSVYAASLR